MKKFMQKLAVAALSLSVLSACQGEEKHGHDHDAPTSAKTAVAAPTSMAIAAPNVNTGIRSDEVKVTLASNQGTEVKMLMAKGARVEYSWTTDGGLVNHDTHGESTIVGTKGSHRYSKGVQVGSDKGELIAAFDGEHGWFWRNRGDKAVTITVKVSGQYQDIKQKK
ncbi:MULTISPECIES: hypothetical protein [Janthinobacterium]|nr:MULTISPECIES: hypothetical protein [Janthinobacterium]PJJ06774.1 hypothetical protein CLU90_5745 [Janthinobacterium sp. 67]